VFCLILFVFPWSVADFAKLPFGFLILGFNRFLRGLFVFHGMLRILLSCYCGCLLILVFNFVLFDFVCVSMVAC